MLSARKPVKIDRGEQLAARPVHAPGAQLERRADSGATIKLSVQGGWFFGVNTKGTRTFELDEIGVLVWDQCDGVTTLEQIVQIVANQYRLNLREAEVATLKFLETLARRRLIQLASENAR